jgi:hypothetical protein
VTRTIADAPTPTNDEDDGCNLTAKPASRTPWWLLPVALLWVARSRRATARRR